MTVNERLYHAGLLGEWQASLDAGNRDRMIAILNQVELADQSSLIADKILADPQQYGRKQ